MITYGPLPHFIAQAAALTTLCKHSKMMQSSYLTTESVDFGHDIAPTIVRCLRFATLTLTTF